MSSYLFGLFFRSLVSESFLLRPSSSELISDNFSSFVEIFSEIVYCFLTVLHHGYEREHRENGGYDLQGKAFCFLLFIIIMSMRAFIVFELLGYFFLKHLLSNNSGM